MKMVNIVRHIKCNSVNNTPLHIKQLQTKGSLKMSTEKTIEATRKEDGQKFSQTFDWPETVDEAVSMWGEEDVYNLSCQAKTVRLQANMRRPSSRKTVSTYSVYKQLIDAGMSDEDSRKISQYAGNADGTESAEQNAA